MAQTSILSSISRTGTFPIRKTINAPNNCGTISLVLNQNWTEQMIHELPTINVAVYIDTDIKLLSIDIDMSTVTSDNIELKPITPYSIPLFDLPTDFDFVVTPIFDEDALLSHNLQIDSGDIDVFNTSDNGIVDTNISSYINEYWTTKTDTFNLNMVFDNSNIASGGSGGGGGGGGQITVDTQVMQGSTNPVQNGAIYDFVNSSVSTNTAYFIGTFNSLSDLENYSGEVSNNDYAFVVSVDSDGNTVYNRYKYNSETETWNFEYSLNNSSFTAAEWETIQSGLTANDRTNYNNHLTNTNNPHSVTKEQVGLGNVDNTSDADKPVSTATQTALNGKQNTLTFDGTYDASTNKAATVSTVTNAINSLDVSSVGGSGKYISAISETNGKISPTVETMDTVPTNGSAKAVTSGGVQAPLAEVIDAGAKNKLKNSAVTQTVGEVVYTVNPDGTVSAYTTTTTTAQRAFLITSTGDNCYVNTGDIITGNPDTELDVAMQCGIGPSGNIVTHIPSEEYHVITVSGYIRYYAIIIRLGVSIPQSSPLIFKPMICTKAEWDISHQFEPYAKTNPELTVENASQQSEIDYAVNTGAKNLINLNPNTYTSGNVVVKLNDDGTVSVSLSSGSTATTTFSRAIKTITDLRDMDLILNGCPSGGNYSSGYALYISDDDTTKEKDEGNGVLVPKNTTVTTSYLALIVRSGTAISGTLTFKPMIRLASITDSTFQPYALPNPTLTPAAIKAVDEGAKNHLYCDMSVMKSVNTNGTWSGSSFAHNSGVTFTVNNDSSITVNGTASDVNGVFVLSTDFTISQGDWILSGTPSGGGSSTYNISIAGIISDIGNTARFSSATNKLVRIYVIAGTTINNLLFKPMICTAADYAVSPKFVPYRPSWQEMWEMIQALQNNS